MLCLSAFSSLSISEAGWTQVGACVWLDVSIFHSPRPSFKRPLARCLRGGIAPPPPPPLLLLAGCLAVLFIFSLPHCCPPLCCSAKKTRPTFFPSREASNGTLRWLALSKARSTLLLPIVMLLGLLFLSVCISFTANRREEASLVPCVVTAGDGA